MKDYLGLLHVLWKTSRQHHASQVPRSRKREIEEICRGLSEKYGSRSRFDVDQALADYNIHCFEDEDYMSLPRTYVEREKGILVAHPYGTPGFKKRVRVHELGHFALSHTPRTEGSTVYEEQEAEFFVKKLIRNFPIADSVQAVSLYVHLDRHHAESYQSYMSNPEEYRANFVQRLVSQVDKSDT